MSKPVGARPKPITETRKYTSNRRGLVGVGTREKAKPLLSDEELAAQSDLIEWMRTHTIRTSSGPDGILKAYKHMERKLMRWT